MNVELMIPGTPVGKGRPRVTRRGVFTPEKTQRFEQAVRAAWRRSGAAMAPKDAAVLCTISAYFSPPKSASRRTRDKLLRMGYHCKRTDADNIVKAVLDAISGLAYSDDSAVQIFGARKFYTSGTPRTEVLLSWEDTSWKSV